MSDEKGVMEVLQMLSDLRGRLSVNGQKVLDQLIMGDQDDEVVAHSMNVAGRANASGRLDMQVSFDDETKTYQISRRSSAG